MSEYVVTVPPKKVFEYNHFQHQDQTNSEALDA